MSLHRSPTPAELRRFAGLWMPLNAAAIGGAMWWLADSPAAAAVVWIAAAVLSVCGLWRPALIRPVFVAWNAAGLGIGVLVTWVMLAMVFFCVLFPFGVTLRLLGRDPLRRRFDPNAATYWTPAERDDPPDRYFRQF